MQHCADGSHAKRFAPIVEKPDALPPSITPLEVFKRVMRQRDEGTALHCVAVMHQQLVNLDAAFALSAAAVGLRHKLPLADSIIYATDQSCGATVWTQGRQL